MKRIVSALNDLNDPKMLTPGARRSRAALAGPGPLTLISPGGREKMEFIHIAGNAGSERVSIKWPKRTRQGASTLKIVGQASLPVVAARASWLAPHLRAVTVPAMPTSSARQRPAFPWAAVARAKKLAHHRQAGTPVPLIRTPRPSVSPRLQFRKRRHNSVYKSEKITAKMQRLLSARAHAH